MATDPVSASLLYGRVMSGGQQPTLKDLVEVIGLVNQLKGPQQPSQDMAQLATALGTMFRSGVEAAQAKNGSDPVAAYQAGMAAVTPLLDRLSETQRLAFESQISSLRNELQQKDPTIFLSKVREMADSLGWGPPQQESEQLAIHRLHGLEEDRRRAYELEKARWEHELRGKEEDKKARAQNDLIRSVSGTVEKLVESPVIRELGKNVGNKIGVPHNPLAEAKIAAAQNVLQNPMELPYEFKCGKCGVTHTFSAKDLTLIGERGGLWMCPSKNCGETYKLKDDKKKDGGGASIA
jgi:hypothetical protein